MILGTNSYMTENEQAAMIAGCSDLLEYLEFDELERFRILCDFEYSIFGRSYEERISEIEMLDILDSVASYCDKEFINGRDGVYFD